jgi:hypothetical protein
VFYILCSSRSGEILYSLKYVKVKVRKTDTGRIFLYSLWLLCHLEKLFLYIINMNSYDRNIIKMPIKYLLIRKMYCFEFFNKKNVLF